MPKLFPGIGKNEAKLKQLKSNRACFHTAVTRQGYTFPVILKESLENSSSTTTVPTSNTLELEMISVPNIAGTVVVDEQGIIQGSNAAFMKQLFGYGTTDLSHHIHMDRLIPQYAAINGTMGTNLTAGNAVMSASMCRRIGSMMPSPTPNSTNAPTTTWTPKLPKDDEKSLAAIHHDGMQFYVELQVRPMIDRQKHLFALWISFRRPFEVVIANSKLLNATSNTGLDPTTSQIISKSTNSLGPQSAVGSKQSLNQSKQELTTQSKQSISKESKQSLNGQSKTSLNQPKQSLEERDPLSQPLNKLTLDMAPQVQSNNAGRRSQEQLSKQQPSIELSLAPAKRTLVDYEEIRKLGEGAFGSVHLVRIKGSPKKVLHIGAHYGIVSS